MRIAIKIAEIHYDAKSVARDRDLVVPHRRSRFSISRALPLLDLSATGRRVTARMESPIRTRGCAPSRVHGLAIPFSQLGRRLYF
jgi:hypothetical protein